MTPEQLAALHARCFASPRPYTAQEFADFLATPACFLCSLPHGFALGRVIVDEAELLTLAVDPNHQSQGIGRQLLTRFETAAHERGAVKAFLDVAANNAAALSLYRKAGYCESGRRRAYYKHAADTAQDAILMEKPLNLA